MFCCHKQKPFPPPPATAWQTTKCFSTMFTNSARLSESEYLGEYFFLRLWDDRSFTWPGRKGKERRREGSSFAPLTGPGRAGPGRTVPLICFRFHLTTLPDTRRLCILDLRNKYLLLKTRSKPAPTQLSHN